MNELHTYFVSCQIWRQQSLQFLLPPTPVCTHDDLIISRFPAGPHRCYSPNYFKKKLWLPFPKALFKPLTKRFLITRKTKICVHVNMVRVHGKLLHQSQRFMSALPWRIRIFQRYNVLHFLSAAWVISEKIQACGRDYKQLFWNVNSNELN